MKLVLLLFLLTISVSTVIAFQNPIIPGFNPDPSIIRVNDDYFLATSSFEYFPGIPIYHSKDLIDWEVIGHALSRPSQLHMRGTAPSGGMFAPTLRYHENRIYMISTWFDIISPPDNTTRMPRSMYVYTDNIWDDSSWSDPIYVDQYGMDPDLFFDDDGKVYLTTTFGSEGLGYPDSGYFAIWTTEIDIETGDSLTESKFSHASSLTNPRLSEGAHLSKRDGTYYLITAESGTDDGHKAMQFRSSSVWGPWEGNPHNPLLFNGRNRSNPILATGHMDLVETSAGDSYVVFLATRNGTGFNQLGRETFLAPANWTDDGWLVVNNGQDITFEMPGLYDLARPTSWRDDFEGGFTDKRWYTTRTPYKKFHKFTEEGLEIRGNVYTLDDRETPAAFFRKQEDLSVIWSSDVSFDPTSPRHEAGLTIFLSNWYHNEIGITLHPNTTQRALVAKTRTGPEATLTTTYTEDIPDGAITLLIKAEPKTYSLGYALENQEPVWVTSLESRWLQAFVTGWQNFVGAHFGLYATGNQLPILQPATFAFVQTELINDESW
ncbi:glycoside hydrolase family 43 protein [Botryobasidium botryosum FD-172 SS1]|uniref:Glycoside hydrolase family 43 protein n=1 Tax=Botryobasidium botryosum (strain FD-172 SS1) TaxID=930990 RepID=A0A067M5K9_BOTB1|nr:glycoside hydrolase family 43 protein [Botryobasidium botryosum FD-172 SS1]